MRTNEVDRNMTPAGCSCCSVSAECEGGIFCQQDLIKERISYRLISSEVKLLQVCSKAWVP